MGRAPGDGGRYAVAMTNMILRQREAQIQVCAGISIDMLWSFGGLSTS